MKAAKIDAKGSLGNSADRSAALAGSTPLGSANSFSIDGLDPHECVAALADSVLSGAEAQAALDRLLSSPDLCTCWHRLHQASDYLRSEEMADCEAGAAFWDGLSARLRDEPTVLAPNRAGGFSMHRIWIRYALPGASTVAAVAIIGWMVIPQYRGQSTGSGVIASNAPASQQTRANLQPAAGWDRMAVADGNASLTSASPPAPASQAGIQDEYAESVELERYLGAHQQFSPRNVHGPVALESASFSTIRVADASYR